jgi:hypothetical protein
VSIAIQPPFFRGTNLREDGNKNLDEFMEGGDKFQKDLREEVTDFWEMPILPIKFRARFLLCFRQLSEYSIPNNPSILSKTLISVIQNVGIGTS